MSSLDKRLDALEQLAKQVRRREIRATLASWPETPDLTPAEMDEAIDEYIRIEDQFVAWKREGLSEHQRLRRYADEQGVPVEDVTRECAAIVAEAGRRDV